MKKGRFLSLLLAIALIIGLLPLTALAASSTGSGISVTTNPNPFIRRVHQYAGHQKPSFLRNRPVGKNGENHVELYCTRFSRGKQVREEKEEFSVSQRRGDARAAMPGFDTQGILNRIITFG